MLLIPQSSAIRPNVFRAPIFWSRRLLGNLEQEIAEEENAGAKPVHRLAEPEVGQHAQLRKPDVDAIQPRDDVEQDQERHDAERDPLVNGLELGACGGRGEGGQAT